MDDVGFSQVPTTNGGRNGRTTVDAESANNRKEDASPGSQDGDGDTRVSSSSQNTVSHNENVELKEVMNRKMSIRAIANTKSYVLSQVYQEYYGLLQFAGVPIDGGFHGLEMKYCNTWHHVFRKTSDEIFFNQVKLLVKAIADHVGLEEGQWNEDVEAVCNEWQETMQRKGLAGMLNYLKSTGTIGKRGTRDRRPAASDAVG